MRSFKGYWLELVRALLVFALVGLNFGHASSPAFASAAGYGGWEATSAGVDCGIPGSDDEDHAPCHACRIGSGADLPGAPCSSLTIHFATESVAFEVPDVESRPALPVYRERCRAPPSLA